MLKSLQGCYGKSEPHSVALEDRARTSRRKISGAERH